MSGYVYFLAGESGSQLIVKIGYTGRHPDVRARDIQAYSPIELDLFGYVHGSMALERKFHETFAPLRMHGEWFHATGKLKDFIWYLANYGAANRVTTADELETAIVDCILAPHVPHPSLDHETYMATVDHRPWRDWLIAYEIELS